MLYTKIRLDFKYGPKNRFYRVVLIKGNPDLFKLGVALLTSLEATFEHCFLITHKGVSYVMAPFMEDPLDGYKYLGKYHLSDLPMNFNLEYDTGDGWDFKCKKYEEKVELKSKKTIILLEGKGQGIWEDNIHSLYALFEGEIDKDFDKEDEEKGIYKPWNFEIDKFGDFDLALDINEINETLDKDSQANYEELYENEKEYIKQTRVCLDDFHKTDNKRFNILEIVADQIKTKDFVNKSFHKLLEYFNEEAAIKFIARVLINYAFKLDNRADNFTDQGYKKELEKSTKEILHLIENFKL